MYCSCIHFCRNKHTFVWYSSFCFVIQIINFQTSMLFIGINIPIVEGIVFIIWLVSSLIKHLVELTVWMLVILYTLNKIILLYIFIEYESHIYLSFFFSSLNEISIQFICDCIELFIVNSMIRSHFFWWRLVVVHFNLCCKYCWFNKKDILFLQH